MNRFVAYLSLGMLTLSFAHAQVTSVNAVGMVKVSVPAENLLFVSLAFNSDSSGLDDVIGDQLTGSNSPLTSDQVIVWNADSQTYESFWKVDGTGTSFDGKWYLDDGEPTPTPAAIQLEPGSGFWIQNKQEEAQDLVLSGEVPDSQEIVPVQSGLNQVGFPYPVALGINDPEFGITQIANGTDSPLTADRLIIWDADNKTYTAVWLVDNTGFAAFDGFWHYDDGQPTPTRADITINPGQGFWFQRKGAGATSWEPSKPYAWP